MASLWHWSSSWRRSISWHISLPLIITFIWFEFLYYSHQDFIRAMRELNGKYIGNRPMKLRKSNWKDRNLDVVRKKDKEKKKLGLRWRGIALHPSHRQLHLVYCHYHYRLPSPLPLSLSTTLLLYIVSFDGIAKKWFRNKLPDGSESSREALSLSSGFYSELFPWSSSAVNFNSITKMFAPLQVFCCSCLASFRCAPLLYTLVIESLNMFTTFKTCIASVIYFARLDS